jgi:protein-tyrosine phosphatase
MTFQHSQECENVALAAIETTASLIRFKAPTLVCCSGGMSRSPCVAAGAIAIVKGVEPQEALQSIIRNQPHDISPAMWEAVCAHVRARRP